MLLSPGNFSANEGYPLASLDLFPMKGRESGYRIPRVLQAKVQDKPEVEDGAMLMSLL